MPTYEYQCTSCGNRIDAVQSFSDDALTHCEACGQDALRKLFGNVGVVFKGSGFYRNDARAEARDKSKAKASGAPTEDSKSTDSGTKKTEKPTETSKPKTDAGAKPTPTPKATPTPKSD